MHRPLLNKNKISLLLPAYFIMRLSSWRRDQTHNMCHCNVNDHSGDSLQYERRRTVTGLGTAATTMPMVGCGESRAGLPQGMVGPGVLASVRLIWLSLGSGEWSFCSCCFFWILRCSCCLASTEGEGSVLTWGWKVLASAVGTKAEAGVGVFIPV